MIGMLAVCASLVVGPEAFDPNGNHIQGIAASEDALYVAQMTRLVKLDWTGKVLASRSVQSHTGDISWHDGELYTAVSVYPERKEGRIQVFDKDLNLVKMTIHEQYNAAIKMGGTAIGSVATSVMNIYYHHEAPSFGIPALGDPITYPDK